MNHQNTFRSYLVTFWLHNKFHLNWPYLRGGVQHPPYVHLSFSQLFYRVQKAMTFWYWVNRFLENFSLWAPQDSQTNNIFQMSKIFKNGIFGLQSSKNNKESYVKSFWRVNNWKPHSCTFLMVHLVGPTSHLLGYGY